MWDPWKDVAEMTVAAVGMIAGGVALLITAVAMAACALFHTIKLKLI
jgi:hypothetical protein